jgi:Fe-S cluster assembly protein SufD
VTQKVLFIKSGFLKEELDLEKTGESKELIIIFIAQGKDVINLETITRHNSINTKGNVWVRGVVMDGAEVKIRGVIKVDKGADKTESFLRQNVLILSDRARADVRPILEIEADDVKASHAATVGRIDKEELFYLTSRGLPIVEAKQLIVEGFFNQALNNINDEGERVKFEKAITRKLHEKQE